MSHKFKDVLVGYYPESDTLSLKYQKVNYPLWRVQVTPDISLGVYEYNRLIYEAVHTNALGISGDVIGVNGGKISLPDGYSWSRALARRKIDALSPGAYDLSTQDFIRTWLIKEMK